MVKIQVYLNRWPIGSVSLQYNFVDIIYSIRLLSEKIDFDRSYILLLTSDRRWITLFEPPVRINPELDINNPNIAIVNGAPIRLISLTAVKEIHILSLSLDRYRLLLLRDNFLRNIVIHDRTKWSIFKKELGDFVEGKEYRLYRA